MTDRTTGIPLYSETYNGSLLDKTQALILVDLLEEKGFESGLLCMDAGFWSKEILNTIEEKGDQLAYLIRVPGHTTAFKELVDIFREDLPQNINQFILSHNILEKFIEKLKKPESPLLLGILAFSFSTKWVPPFLVLAFLNIFAKIFRKARCLS